MTHEQYEQEPGHVVRWMTEIHRRYVKHRIDPVGGVRHGG